MSRLRAPCDELKRRLIKIASRQYARMVFWIDSMRALSPLAVSASCNTFKVRELMSDQQFTVNKVQNRP
jgi:hypothetical protein